MDELNLSSEDSTKEEETIPKEEKIDAWTRFKICLFTLFTTCSTTSVVLSLSLWYSLKNM